VTGDAAKRTKEIINRERIYPPLFGDRKAILDAAGPRCPDAAAPVRLMRASRNLGVLTPTGETRQFQKQHGLPFGSVLHPVCETGKLVPPVVDLRFRSESMSPEQPEVSRERETKDPKQIHRAAQRLRSGNGSTR